MKRLAILSLSLFAVLCSVVGCGSGAPEQQTAREVASTAPIDYASMRDKVILGLAKDFRAGTHAGPSGYGICVRLGMGRALTPAQLDRLVAIYRRPQGRRLAAQALNALAAPVGARCGGAGYVPELVKAAAALGGEYPLNRLAVAARRLGVTYGPYLGVTCHKPGASRCDRVGVDLVLRRQARAVTVRVGDRSLTMRTPGLHSGEAGRDWVGYIHRAGLGRPGSPFHIPSNGRRPSGWAGYPAVYLSVGVKIEYPDGTVASGALPRVVLSPGWG